MNTKPNFFINAGPLFLVLFIDAMGLGLVIPILNTLLVDGQSGFLSHALSPTMHTFLYGAILASFMFSWFFGAAFLGDLSDRIGRKKSLLICMTGAFLSYLISALSIPFHSFTLLLVGRVVAGLTAGSQPIAQAAIVDLSPLEYKARNLGLIFFSMSMGFILGPLCGGLLSNHELVSWFSFATPFYYAACLSLINILLLWALFKDTREAQVSQKRFNPYQAINIFVSAFKDIEVRGLSIIFFVFMFGWSSYYSFSAMFLLEKFNYTPARISVFMALMGIGFGIGNGLLVDFFTRRYSLKNNFIFSTFVAGLFVLLTAVYSQQAWVAWVSVIPLCACVSVAFAAAITLFSNQVSPEKQGWAMGITGSIMAFVFGTDSMIVGWIASWDAVLAIFISAFGFILAVGLTYALLKKTKPVAVEVSG